MADNVIVRVPEQQFIRGEDGYSPEVTIEDIAHGHSVNITDREHPEGQSFDVLDGASAYEQAVAGGYTGTEAQFNEDLTNFKTLHDETEEVAPFYAEYGVTTKAEIAAAINGKRQIYAYQSLSPYSPILPYVGKIYYADEHGSGTGYRFALTEGRYLTIFELTSSWNYRSVDLEAPAQRAEAAADQALNRMNSADQSAQSAAGSASNASRDAGTASTAATTATAKAGEASDSATAADDSAKDAEAYAIGKRGGTDVGSTDSAYHNNAKYYAEQAASSASDAVTAKGAAETAQGKAEDAQEAAEAVLESIPADYTELTEDVAELQSAVSLEPIALQYTSGGTGFVKHADGAISTSSLSSHTDYVDISDYPYLYYKRQGSNANNPTAGLAFYDGNKVYICGESAVAQQAQSGYLSDLKKIAVPPDAKYARFSTYTDENTYGAFEVYGESIIENKVTETADIIAPLLPESLPYELFSGQYIYNGTTRSAVGWYTTSFIDVSNINKIIYTRPCTPETWAGYGMSWFDENKEYIDISVGSVGYTNDYSYVLTCKDVPTGAKYIRLSVIDRDNLNMPFGIYDYAEYEKAIAPNAKKFAPVVGSPHLYLATAPVDPDFDIRSSGSGGTSYSDIYDRYDALCTTYPHWIKRDTDIGVDSENNPIARYTVRMYDPLVFLGDGIRTPPFTGSNVWENKTQYRRALLTAGVHGNERVGVMGLYYLIKDILSSNDEWARYIKSNYILEIIPIINPGGFNANRRRNANNVDINRDYMKRTTIEAQEVTTFIQSIKNDLYCVLDFHGSYELGFLATPQNSHIINKMMTLATQTISACADDWGSIESIIGNTSDYYPYSYGCLSENAGTLTYYAVMNNITPYAFTVESPCLLLDTTVQANSAKVVAAAKMAMDQGCNVLQALLCI